MEMKAVTSKMLGAVGYDSATKTLRVRYNNGGEYDHVGVEQGTVDALLAAESIGSHFAKNIRTQFPATKHEVVAQ